MSLKKRSLKLAGHETSLALEPAFWRVLETAAASEGCSLAAYVRRIDESRGEEGLASACRLAALAYAVSLSPEP